MCDVIGLQLRPAEHATHRQRARILIRVGLSERLRDLGTQGVTEEETAPRSPHFRDEDATELVRSLDSAFDRVAVLAEARVRYREAGLAKGVANGARVVPIRRTGQPDGRQWWNDPVRVEHDVTGPSIRDEDGVLGSVGRDAVD